MLNTASTSGLGIIYWWLAVKLYQQTDVGWSSAVISTMTLLSSLSQLNLSGALTRFVPNAGKQARRLIMSAYLVSVVVSFAAGIVFALGHEIFDTRGIITGSSAQTAWFIASVVMWSIFALQDYAMIGLRQAGWVLAENTVFGVVKIGLLFVFASWMGRYGIFASWTIPFMLSTIPINYLIFARFLRNPERAGQPTETLTARQIGNFVMGDYLGAMFWTLSTMSLPILVVSQAGEAAGAYFYTAWTIGYAFDLMLLNMGTSLTVEGSIDQQKLDAYARSALIHVLQLLAVPMLVVLAAAPLLLSIYGSAYSDAGTTLLRVLVLAAVPRAVNALYLSRARVQRHIGKIVLVQAAGCIMVLTLGFFLLRGVGITGIGIAWLLSQTILAVVILLSRILARPGAKSVEIPLAEATQ
jgi:O-antigen/teichoic acid export membrane protein